MDSSILNLFSEIIIIDNRSTDKTIQRARDYILDKSLPIKIHINNQNNNLGGTLKNAINYAITSNFAYLGVIHGDDQGNPEDCWLLAAAKAKLPMVVPGHEDSTFGNIFASHVKFNECNASIVKSGIEYMGQLYDDYKVLSKGKGVGFFQIGGGISGDFPICVVPSIKYDLQQPVKPWAYFCQISDSTTSYGSYSGATPNEKITWDKLTQNTPMFVIESDATIVVPLMLSALLECKANSKAANAVIHASRTATKKSLARG